jgi:hypothetical protein
MTEGTLFQIQGKLTLSLFIGLADSLGFTTSRVLLGLLHLEMGLL